MPKKKTALTIEERLQQALVPAEEQPYEVPKNWVWVRLGAVCFFENGYAFKSDKFSSEKGIPVIRISNIKENNVDLDDCIKTLEENIDEKFIVHQGDLLIAMSGATTGKNGVYMSANIAYLNQRVGNIKVKNKELLIEKFRNFYIANMQNEILNTAYGGAQPNISSQKMSVMTFPLPPLSEQQRIIERIEVLFAKLDEAKERLQEVADSFAVRKAAILHKAFTGELTKQWRRENGVSDESWEEKKFDDCIEKMQNGLSKRKGDEGNNIGVLRLANLSEDDLVLDDLRYILLTEKEEKNYLLSKDDVIMIRVNGSKDNVARQIVINTDEKLAFCDHIIRIKYNPNIVARYVMYFSKTNAYRKYVEDNMVSSAGQNTISRKGLASLVIPLPSIEEQHEIVRLIDDLLARERAAQQAAEQALASIDLMKKSILARAFRGELSTNKASEASALELLKQVLAEN